MLKGTSREFARIFNIDGETATAYLLEGKEALVQTHFKGTYEIARIGSYVIIPVGADRLVGLITKLRVEEHEHLVNRQKIASILPEAWRLLDFTLVGTLKIQGKDEKEQTIYKFERGITNYPTIESPVWFITEKELSAIFSFPQMANYLNVASLGSEEITSVYFDINKMFGKHLAVLGCTGSGKSCTVASIIHQIIEKKKEITDPDDYLHRTGFLVLDINGEYARAFKDQSRVNLLTVKKQENGETNCLSIPYWLFNFTEFCQLFTPSPQSQKPVLRNAIRYLRWKQDYTNPSPDINPSAQDLETSYRAIRSLYDSANRDSIPEVNDFNKAFKIENLDKLILDFGISQRWDAANRRHYYLRDGRHAENMSTLIERIKSIIDEPSYKVIFPDIDCGITYTKIQETLLGIERDATATIKRKYDLTILDLSFLSMDLLQTVTSFIGRVVFSFFQHLPPQLRREYPFILVLEEAHNYLPRMTSDTENINLPYEKIAKEGRKYGLGIVIASQRPGELSETALSQCNTLVVHRLVNPIDKNIVRSAVSVIDEDALKLLPSLGPRQAIVLGEAVNIPARITINELPLKKRPHSENPYFIGKPESEKQEGDNSAES
jgi:hypothetical protein